MNLAFLPPFGTWAGELSRAGLFAVAFAVIIAVAETWYRRLHPPVEWTRKFVHLAFGGLALLLPWLFAHVGTVLALATLGALPLVFARRSLPSVFAVERSSRGELYFPLGIVLLFAVANRQPVFYLISMLTLVVCDALAAVLGKAYGRHPYRVTIESRSLEGSAAFLFTAFMCVHLPLLLMTDIDRLACVLVAAQLALIVTSFEAIGTKGNDNLLVPLATYYLLVKLTPQGVGSISIQLAVQLAILITTLWVARSTKFLTFSGAIAAHLVLYAAFSLGGPPWIVAPLLALAAAIVIDRVATRATRLPAGGYDVRVIYYVSIVAVLLLLADNTFATLVPGPAGLTSGHPFHALFVGALAAALAIISHWAIESIPRARKRSTTHRALASASLGYAIVTPMGLWMLRGESAGTEFVTAALLCAGGLLLYMALRRWLRPAAGSLWDFRLLAIGVLAATAVVMPLHLFLIGAVDWSLR